MSEPVAPIRIELASDPVFLSGTREMLTNIASRLGFDDLGCCKLALALDEALTNVIRHGYENRTDGRISVSVWPLGDVSRPPCGLRLVVEDEAPVVDIEQIKGRDLDEIRPGGLGVHIISEIMDEVSYEPRGDRGMRLTMVKHAPDTPDAPESEVATTTVKAEGPQPTGSVRYGSRRGH